GPPGGRPGGPPRGRRVPHPPAPLRHPGGVRPHGGVPAVARGVLPLGRDAAGGRRGTARVLTRGPDRREGPAGTDRRGRTGGDGPAGSQLTRSAPCLTARRRTSEGSACRPADSRAWVSAPAVRAS